MSETIEIPRARIPIGTPPARRPSKPPEVVHFYDVVHLRPRLGQSLRFLCGGMGVLDYRGMGQHRPIPATGVMAPTLDVSVCVDCEELYAEEIAPRTLEAMQTPLRELVAA